MAESEILRAGQWEPRRFQAEGAVHVEIMGPSGTPLRLEADGLQSQLRRQTAAGGAFAVHAARDGATLFAAAESGEAFPGGAVVDLSLSFPSARRDYLVERIDISGHSRAPLARIAAEGDSWVLSPVETAPAPSTLPPSGLDGSGQHRASVTERDPDSGVGTIPELLGAWIGRRRSDSGAAVLPDVAEIRIDRSASMIPRQERIDILRDLVLALARAGGGPLPVVVEGSIGGATRNGVGSVALDAGRQREGAGRTLLITDVPVRTEGIANLVIGDPRILEVLEADDACGVTSDAWLELEREDSRFDDATLRRLEALIDWLTDGSRGKGALR
ncbi:hypothetical protein [Brachybacterium sp. 107]|uniref:hypothetical protein n=1 Tax=Brachybacterium sp. 107 TaxID=3457736 RepID=UPI0040335C6C